MQAHPKNSVKELSLDIFALDQSKSLPKYTPTGLSEKALPNLFPTMKGMLKFCGNHGVFVVLLLLASSGGAYQQAEARSLLSENDTEGRHLAAAKCIYSSSENLVCTGYPYPACCTSTGSDCVTYPPGTSVTCTDSRTPYPGCCSDSSSGSSSSKCFPASATVETPQGKKAMSELKVGDEVLTVDSNGGLHSGRVYMFSHHDETSYAPFITLRTAANSTIRVTPGHYVWATLGATVSEEELSFATSASISKPETLSKGDFLWVRVSTSAKVEPIQIVEIGEEVARGLYNPHVLGGSIIVDDVTALAFPDTLPPSLWAHRAVTSPMRLFYALLPSDTVAMKINLALLRLLGKANPTS